MKNKYLYDIVLDEQVVGNSGDMDFDTEAEAKVDANDFISGELSKEYNRNINDFKILPYKAIY